MFDLRAVKVLVLGALAMLLVLTLPSFSTAVFTSTSSSTATVGAAADWAKPVVSLVNLPEQVSGLHLLQAEASDDHGSGVASVTIETRPIGGSWTVVCTDTTVPYGCEWDTTKLTNGGYQVRATALDHAGFLSDPAIATIVVHNQVADSVAPELEWVTKMNQLRPGSRVTFTVQASDAGSGVSRVVFEYTRPNLSTWVELCTLTRPSQQPDLWSCTFTVPNDNGRIDFAVTATDAAGNSTRREETTTVTGGGGPSSLTSEEAQQQSVSVDLSSEGEDD